MVRTMRWFAGVALLTIAVLLAGSGTGRRAFAADDQKDEKKDEKKLELPKLPKGSNPKWDFETVEEKFTVVKGGINDVGNVYFLLEAKEDMALTPRYKAVFTDSDGVKYYSTSASCDPSNKVKKGDRVRLVLTGGAPATAPKNTWENAVKVKFIDM